VNFGQVEAAPECIIAQLGDARGYDRVLQRPATTKCLVSDDLQLPLIEMHFDQVDTAFECSTGDDFDLWPDTDAGDFTLSLLRDLFALVEEDTVHLEDAFAFAPAHGVVYWRLVRAGVDPFGGRVGPSQSEA